MISVQPSLRRVLFKTLTKFGTPAKLSKGEVIMRSSHEIAGQVIMYLNVELELDLVYGYTEIINLLHND